MGNRSYQPIGVVIKSPGDGSGGGGADQVSGLSLREGFDNAPGAQLTRWRQAKNASIHS